MALIEFQNDSAPYLSAENLNNNFTECYNIVDSGSNANGSYIKYSDGTMMCYKEVTGTVDISTAWGSLYASSDVSLGTWPENFYAKPVVNAYGQAPSGTQYMLCTNATSDSTSTTNAGKVTLIRPNSRTGVAYTIYVTAIGKWK